MKTREDLKQAMRAAIAVVTGNNHLADAATAAALTAIETAGCVVVPKVATNKMRAAFDEINWSMEAGECGDTYNAMLSASPYR